MNIRRKETQVVLKGFKWISLLLILVLALGSYSPIVKNSVAAEDLSQPSHNVAVIDSFGVINGGYFPTTSSGPTGSFLDFHFYILPYTNLSLAALAPGGVCGSEACDTVLLNVASSGLSCNINNLTAQQKGDLVSFVALGRKLIIYDSECSTQDYSWLPFPFTTANPGQMGANGTLTIVEENTLSSNDPASPYYINVNMLGVQTDSVGDMNVMTTYDPNWFLDMTGTNILGVSGPVHTYAKYPAGTDFGLIIYNGLDTDYLYDTTPDATTPAGNLAKIWLQELQQHFNPSKLPGGYAVVGINLSPNTANLLVGKQHTVTATLTDLLGNPQPGILVTFSITSGPNTGVTGTCDAADCKTNASGQVSFSYIGVGAGTDQIKGCFTNQNNVLVCSQIVTANWTSSEYVALGDSFSSGEGNPPFINETDGPTDYCHRSKSAYSFVLSKDLGLPDPKFFACSGAVTDNVVNTSRYGENPQIIQPDINNPAVKTAGLITMTIGGNDAGFADVLKVCIAQKVASEAAKAAAIIHGVGPLPGVVAVWLGLGLDSCANVPFFKSNINKQIVDIGTDVKNTYVILKGRAPNASIIIANYPHLFSDSLSEQNCLALKYFLTPADQQYFNQATDLLDNTLQTAANAAGVPLVDVRPFFSGHGICAKDTSGNDTSWVNGISLASGSGGSCIYSRDGYCLIQGLPVVGSFHPNGNGHADGYAAAIKNFINSGPYLSPRSNQTDSLALSNISTTTDPAIVVKTLTTEPVTAGTQDCEGTYKAGQQVLVSGEGFAPGESVQLYVLADGLGLTAEQLVGQFTADSSGQVTGTIRIPINAIGFAPSEATAGFVFIHAIGLGPDGAHVDNVAMLGLAPQTSICGTVEPFNYWLPAVIN